jgi:hypothetical protein
MGLMGAFGSEKEGVTEREHGISMGVGLFFSPLFTADVGEAAGQP